jgi:hypothetical protein
MNTVVTYALVVLTIAVPASLLTVFVLFPLVNRLQRKVHGEDI